MTLSDDDRRLRAIGVLMVAWPHLDWPEATVTLWAGFLREFSPITVERAAERAVRTEERLPSIARFCGMCESLMPRSEFRALPAGPSCPPEVAAQWIGTIRGQLAASTGPLTRTLRRTLSHDRTATP